jgi:hypothetical protein
MLACLTALSMCAGALASTRSGDAVRVQVRPSVAGNVHISFRPTIRLPSGGYYYAVIVLRPYGHYTRTTPPPCATSSDMQKTDYGYARPGEPVKLGLTRAPSAAHRWCYGGSYVGAVYAVPNTPPCNSTYPCRSESYEATPCFQLQDGRLACGVVARPRTYAYPDGLPAPVERGTRIVGYFRVAF